MEFELRTDDLLLRMIAERCAEELFYSDDVVLELVVRSDGFVAAASMNTDRQKLTGFAAALSQLYGYLQGTAVLREDDKDGMYIQFDGDGSGYISVRGRLEKYGEDGCRQRLEFESRFDQTYLREFSREIYDTYGKYAQM